MEKEDSTSSSPAKRSSRRNSSNRTIPSIRVTRQSTGSRRPQDVPFASSEHNMENWKLTPRKDRARKEKRGRPKKQRHEEKKTDRQDDDYVANDEKPTKPPPSKRRQGDDDEEEEHVEQNSPGKNSRNPMRTAHRNHPIRNEPRSDAGGSRKVDEGEKSTSENEFTENDSEEEERGGDSEEEDEDYVEDDDDNDEDDDEEEYEEDDDMISKSTPGPKKQRGRPRRSNPPVPMKDNNEKKEVDIRKPKRKQGIPKKHVVREENSDPPTPPQNIGEVAVAEKVGVSVEEEQKEGSIVKKQKEENDDGDDGEYEWEDDDNGDENVDEQTKQEHQLKDGKTSTTFTSIDNKKRKAGTDDLPIPKKAKKRSLPEDEENGEEEIKGSKRARQGSDENDDNNYERSITRPIVTQQTKTTDSQEAAKTISLGTTPIEKATKESDETDDAPTGDTAESSVRTRSIDDFATKSLLCQEEGKDNVINKDGGPTSPEKEKEISREDKSNIERDMPPQPPLPSDGNVDNKPSVAQESNNATKATTTVDTGSVVIETEADRMGNYSTKGASNSKETETTAAKLSAGNNLTLSDGQEPIRDPNSDQSRNGGTVDDHDRSRSEEIVNRKEAPTLADASNTSNTIGGDPKADVTTAASSENAMEVATGRPETPKGNNEELPQDFLVRWDIIPIKIPQSARSAGKKLGMRVAKSTFPELLSGEHCLVKTISSEGLASEYGIREGDWIVSKQMASYKMTDYYYVAQELTRKGKAFEMQLIRKRSEGETIESRCEFMETDVIMKMPVEQLCPETGALLRTFKTAYKAKRAVSTEVKPHKMKCALLGKTTPKGNRRPHMFCGFFWRLKGSNEKPPLWKKGDTTPPAPSKKRTFTELNTTHQNRSGASLTNDISDEGELSPNGWRVTEVDNLCVAMKYNGDSKSNLKRPRLETETDASRRSLRDFNRIRIVPTPDVIEKDGIAEMVFQRLSLQYGEYDGDASAMPAPDTSLEPMQKEERSSGINEGKLNEKIREAESNEKEKDDSGKLRLLHSMNVPAPCSFKRHRPTGEVVLPPVLLEKDDETDALPKSLRHLPPSRRITVFDRRKGKVYSGEKGVLVKDLAAVLEGNASLEPIVPPPGSNKNETEILREARSAPSTVVCATIRQQLPAAPSFKCGELVRITKGNYKNEIATFERSLPNGWSEVSSYPTGAAFWIQTELLTTKPCAKKNKKKKNHRISAQKLESIFTESIDQCFQEAAQGQTNTYAGDRQLSRSKELAKKNVTTTFAKHFAGY